jgi:hypothetical protein
VPVTPRPPVTAPDASQRPPLPDSSLADSVTPTQLQQNRQEWLADRVREGADILLCHPRLVQTGPDLIDWPSICWYQTDFSLYVMRHASRRSWRIGEHQKVDVTHLVYGGTLQAEVLTLVAAKMRSALLIEGDLPEDGLAALGGGTARTCSSNLPAV